MKNALEIKIIVILDSSTYIIPIAYSFVNFFVVITGSEY